MDKCTWQEVGSSFLPGELIAAFLWAQLEEAERITNDRLASWARYHELLEPPEAKGMLRRPVIPQGCRHNAHIYYVLLAPGIDRKRVLEVLKRNEIYLVLHYVPLHASPAGKRYGRFDGALDVTVQQSERLVILSMWVCLSDSEQVRVADTLRNALAS